MLRLIEGFDFMPSGLSAAERERLWAAKGYYGPSSTLNSVPADVRTGRFNSGKALSYTWTANVNPQIDRYVIPLGDHLDTVFFGTAMYRGALTTSNVTPYIGVFDAVSSVPQFSVALGQYGVIRVYRGDTNGTLLATSDVGVFQEDQVFYVEVGGVIAPTGGSIEVRVNTETVISLPSVNTRNSANSWADSFTFGVNRLTGIDSACDVSFDDAYLCDDAGAANNSFLGNCRVLTQKVAGNSSPQDFAIGGTSPAATAWQSLLNQNLNDTKFIYDGTAGHRSLFTLEAIVNSPMVFGTQLSGAYRMDDATQRVVGNVIKSGATAAVGADHYINQTYTFYKDIWELNPATGVGFTGADLNALLVGPNVNV